MYITILYLLYSRLGAQFIRYLNSASCRLSKIGQQSRSSDFALSGSTIAKRKCITFKIDQLLKYFMEHRSETLAILGNHDRRT